MEYGVYQDLLYKKICLQHYNHDKTICDNLTGDALDYVQSQGSYWLQYNNIALLVPSIVVACYLGSWGDRHGKKMAMLASSFSTLLGYLIFVIISVYEDSPVELLLLANFVSGLGGGYLLMVASVMSYVADITTSENRTSRVAMLESMTFLGSTFGPLISGYLLDGTSYAYTFLFCVSCNTVVIIYIVVCIRNKIPVSTKTTLQQPQQPNTSLPESGLEVQSSDSNRKERGCNFGYIYDCLIICFKKRDGQIRMFIGFLMASCLCVFFASDGEFSGIEMYHPIDINLITNTKKSTAG